MVSKQLKLDKNNIVVLDSCASNLDTIKPLFVEAKLYNHSIIYMFITTNASECKKRAGNNWIGKDLEDRYSNNFVKSVPKLKELANVFFLVKDSNESTFETYATKIAKLIELLRENDRICQPKT